MNRTLAQVLSAIFHPLLLPAYLFFIILYLLPTAIITFPLEQRWLILLVVAFTTFVIPGVGTYYMYRNGYISSMQVENRSERALPFFFTFLCYAVTTYMFFREGYIDRLLVYIIGLVTLSVLLTFIFSFFWKISAHGIGLGGALGIFLLLQALFPDSYLLYIITASIVITGFVVAARLALDAHTPNEVYTGLLLGFSIGLGAWLTLI